MKFFSKSNISFIILAIFIVFAKCFAFASQEIENNRIPIIWNVNNANEYFIGRIKLLENLYQSFNDDNVIAIVGGPGFGKSQLAKKYAQVYKHHYDLVWWFDVNRGMEEQIIDLATEWNRHATEKKLQINIYSSPDDLIQQLKDRLRVTNLHWLLIFDDVTDKGQIATYLPERQNQKGRGDIIITSRNLTAWQKTIKVDEFTPAEAIELLTKITKENNIEEATILADKLKNYPLVIAQAASYIKLHPGVDIKQYSQLFLTNRNTLWKEDDLHKAKYQALDDYKFTAYTTLFLTIEKLQQESPEAFHLLVLCSMINNKKIPTQFLKAYLADHYSSNSIEQEEAIACLMRYALLLKNEIEEGTKIQRKLNKSITDLEETLTIHATVQLVVQDMLSDKVKKIHLENALASMAKFLPNKLRLSNSTIDQYDFILAHIDALTAYAEKYELYNKDLVIILIKELEYWEYDRRNFATSAKKITKIEKILDHMTFTDKAYLCRFFLMKATYNDWAKSDYKQALEEVEKAWIILKDQDEQQYNEEFLRIYIDFSNLYNRLGDNEKALNYAVQGEELSKKYSGLEQLEKLFHCLAKIYIDKGNLIQALNYITKASLIIKERSGFIVPGDLSILILEVEVLLRLNRLDQAYTKLQPLYIQTKELFPNDDNVLKGHIMVFYGYISSMLVENNFKKAIEDVLKGQEIMMYSLGNNFYQKKMSALSYKFLGNIYEREGEYARAQEEYLKAVKLYKDSIYSSPAVAIDDISDVYAKLATVSIKLQDQPMTEHYLDLHRKNFGHEHKRTKEIIKQMFAAKMQIKF